MTVVLAVGVTGVALDAPPEPAPTALFSLSVEGDRIQIDHDGGEPVDVTDLTVSVRVNGTPLDRDPPVPFFSAAGFRAGPTGPFNVADDGEWRAGESASFRIASTNEPVPRPGDRVTVTLAVRNQLVASLETTARPAG